MKPRFALDLSSDSIGVLERNGESWILLGEADLNDPNFDRQMSRLRSLAEKRAAGPFVTKLIIPDSQILYLDVRAPGPDRKSRRAQIVTALEGRTPYAVADLAYDWSRSGGRVQVAVLAKVTLDEAEDFAESYGFRPAAFVAKPDPQSFAGEPFFGLCSSVDAHLPPDQRFDRDQDPVRVVPNGAQTPIWPNDANQPLPEPQPKAAFVAPNATQTADAIQNDTAVEGVPSPLTAGAGTGPIGSAFAGDPATTPSADDALAVAEAPFVEVLDEMDFADVIEPRGSDLADMSPAAAPDLAAVARKSPLQSVQITSPTLVAEPEDLGPPPANGAFQSRRTTGPAGQAGARLATVTGRIGVAAAVESARTPRLGAAQGADPLPQLGPRTHQPGPTADVGQANGFGGRVEVAETAKAALAKAGTAGLAVGQAALTAGKALTTKGFDTARRVIVAKPAQNASGPSVFGDSSPRRRTTTQLPKPQLFAAAVGLIGVAVALWLVWFMAAPQQPVADTPAETAAAQVAGPDTPTALGTTAPVTPPPADTASDSASPTTPASAVATNNPGIVAPDSSDPAARISLNASEGLANAVTGTEPPSASATLPALAQDDAAPVVGGAMAPPAIATADVALPAQALPQPFGTIVRYDAQGLIIPTPEGVVTPGGFTLFSAKPPRIPRDRPAAVTAAWTKANAAAAPAANPLAGKNPRLRPASLTPPNLTTGASTTGATGVDGQTTAAAVLPPLAGPVDPRHAAHGPKARPAAIAATAEAARHNAEVVADAAASAARAEAEAAANAALTATKQAVASSRRPAARPRNFSKTVAAAAPAAPAIDSSAVEAALAEAQTLPDVQTQPEAPAPEAASTAPAQAIDEPDIQGGVPNMPTTRTVAKKATLANAIDLGDINLIGVYGSSGGRRALIRMPNGRYLKVKVGDRLDGGQVAAIGDGQLSYVKKGRTYVLKILNKG